MAVVLDEPGASRDNAARVGVARKVQDKVVQSDSRYYKLHYYNIKMKKMVPRVGPTGQVADVHSTA